MNNFHKQHFVAVCPNKNTSVFYQKNRKCSISDSNSEYIHRLSTVLFMEVIQYHVYHVNWGCIFITKTDVSHKCSSLLFDLGNTNSKLCCFVYVIHSNTKMTVFTLNLWILLITNCCIIYDGKLIIRFFFLLVFFLQLCAILYPPFLDRWKLVLRWEN